MNTDEGLWRKVKECFQKEISEEEYQKKRIDALILESLHYETMAFKYYRATLAGVKGMKRQAAKIKRLKAKIADIEFANQYPDGKPVEQEAIND